MKISSITSKGIRYECVDEVARAKAEDNARKIAESGGTSSNNLYAWSNDGRSVYWTITDHPNIDDYAVGTKYGENPAKSRITAVSYESISVDGVTLSRYPALDVTDSNTPQEKRHWYAWSLPRAYISVLYTTEENPSVGDNVYQSYNSDGSITTITSRGDDWLTCEWDDSGHYTRDPDKDVDY